MGYLIFSIAVSTIANAWWVIFDEDGNPGVMGGVFFDDPKIGILCAQETYPGTDKLVPIWLSEQLEQIVLKKMFVSQPVRGRLGGER